MGGSKLSNLGLKDYKTNKMTWTSCEHDVMWPGLFPLFQEFYHHVMILYEGRGSCILVETIPTDQPIDTFTVNQEIKYREVYR